MVKVLENREHGSIQCSINWDGEQITGSFDGRHSTAICNAIIPVIEAIFTDQKADELVFKRRVLQTPVP